MSGRSARSLPRHRGTAGAGRATGRLGAIDRRQLVWLRSLLALVGGGLGTLIALLAARHAPVWASLLAVAVLVAGTWPPVVGLRRPAHHRPPPLPHLHAGAHIGGQLRSIGMLAGCVAIAVVLLIMTGGEVAGREASQTGVRALGG